MIRRLVGWFLLLPLSALLVVFALANQHYVEVGFDPISPQSPIFGPVHVPLFVVIYLVLIAGIVLGGIASWFAQGRQRREKKLWRRQAQKLEREKSQAEKRTSQREDVDLVPYSNV